MSKIIERDVEKLVIELSKYKEKIEGKNFLVTGGAGFLGSWTCDVLSELGGNVICLDNFVTGSEKNIKHLLEKHKIKLVKNDVCDFNYDEKIDYIIHMASIASPQIYQQNPVETLDSNIIGTKNMLELARKNKVEAFVFASTSEVYGDSNEIPTPETYYGYVNPFGPRCMYDEGKRAGEAYCYSYFKKFGLPIRIARIFNTYGPRLDVENTIYGRVIVKFIKQSLKREPLTVYGDGTQTRSFCYVSDTINGIMRLCLEENLDGEVFNIGNNEEIRIIDLAYKVKEITKSDSEIIFLPLPQDDPKRRCPDISKARRLLGYEPKIGLEEGLKRTIDWFMEIV
ncbi:MAG: UDP-glucuronic acid decarboxylase family protein [Candidatus Aenigmatarchaeota archaeon]